METKINTETERAIEVINNLKRLEAEEKDENKKIQISEHISSLIKIYAEYKVTYHSFECGLALVRIKDDAILYTTTDEKYMNAYAAGYCAARQAIYYTE